MLRLAPVIRRDHLLRQSSDASDCNVIEIQAGLLVPEEAAVEPAAFVAAIGAHHRKSPRQRGRLTGRLRPQRQSDAAVQSSPALKQEAPVPLIGQRQSETDPVCFAVGSYALVDHALDVAECGNRHRNRSRKVRIDAQRAGR